MATHLLLEPERETDFLELAQELVRRGDSDGARDQALSEPRLDRSVTFTQRAWHKGIWELGKAKRLAKKVLQRP